MPARIQSRVTLSPNTPYATSIHRVALAPLTRLRNTPGTQIPTDLATEYYSQRASEGGLLISEGTYVSKEAGGYPTAPGIYSQEQIEAWKKVTDAVHAKGAKIWIQFWSMGRANDGKHNDPEIPTVAPSAIGLPDHPVPKALTIEEIHRFLDSYSSAAKNALAAGFDGIELHSANGYLVDQFLQSVSNKRTDEFGGDWKGRSKFLFEAVKRIVDVFGQERTGIRFSPWGRFQEMLEKNPYETFVPVNRQLQELYPKLGYVHFLESRNWSGQDGLRFPEEGVVESNDIFRAIWRGSQVGNISASEYANLNSTFPDPTDEYPTLFLSSAGHDDTNSEPFVERTGDVLAIGRYFIANPDLPHRLLNHLPLHKYDRSTFYGGDAHGYTDYPTYEEEEKQKDVKNDKLVL